MRAARRSVLTSPMTSAGGQESEPGTAGGIAQRCRVWIRRAWRPVGWRPVRWGVAVAAVLAGLGWAAVSVWLPGPLNTKTTCVYTANSRSALNGFDQLTGQQVSCVLLYNDTNTTWSEWAKPWFTDSHGGDTDWGQWLSADRAARRVVISQEMVPDGVPSNWREIGAAGGYEEYARQLAVNLVAAGMGNAVIRLGHEMNGNWYHDALGNDPAQYGGWAAYWARIVKVMRSVPGARFLFDWNVNVGYRNIPLVDYYPGDSVVDMIGIDVYDSGMPGNPRDPAVRWTRLNHEPGGLAQIVAFARWHGKPLSVPEWGVVNASGGGLGDDPAYVTGIADTIKDNNVVYQAYFNRAVGGVMVLKDAPRSLQLWVKYFGPQGTVQGRSWLRSAAPTPTWPGRRSPQLRSAPATRSVIVSQLYSASQPSLRRERPESGPSRSRASHAVTASAIASAEGSQTDPCEACVTRCRARFSGADVVTTGTPQASASSTAMPNPSLADGNTATLAALSSAYTSFCSPTSCRKSTACATSRDCASDRRLSRSGPSPTMRQVTGLPSACSRATASRSRSMRLCDMSRPTTTTSVVLASGYAAWTASRSMPFGAARIAARGPSAVRSAWAVCGEAAII
jgi:hypothetical protein